MSVSVPAGGLQISVEPDGAIKSNIRLHVRFNLCPTWTELALRHLEDAESAAEARRVAWGGSDESAKGAALEKEFEAAMQAIMASAIALDAFYAIVQHHVVLPADLKEKWRSGRTPRYSQLAEVLRRAFALKAVGTKTLRNNLKEIFRFRDLAVHPSGKHDEPVLHPELNVGVEWRFAYFSASNARLIVDAATAIVWDLCHNGKASDKELKNYLGALRERLTAIFPSGHPAFQQASPAQQAVQGPTSPPSAGPRP